MSSRQRIIPILDGNVRITNAREPRDVGHTIRELLKFSLAISAVGSAAYGAYQAFLQTEKPRSSTVAARQEERRPAKSFFEVLIEADREALKNHETAGRNPFLSELRGTIVPGESAGRPPESRQSLRSTFGSSIQPGHPGPNSWNTAFLTEPVPKAPAPAPNATPPAPKPLAANPVTAGPAASPPAAPASPPRPQQGFADARRAAPPPRPDTTASSGGQRFAEVHVGAPKQLLRPDPDDMEFANTLIRAAEMDFQAVQPAQTVVSEFIRRYPKTAEAELLTTRIRQAQAAHAEALSERTSVGGDTPIAAVQFGGDAADAIRECLSRAIELEQLAAIVRPVRHAADKPAFLVAATINSSWRGTMESREAHLAAARTRLTAQIGPCLAPLLSRGTVSLSVNDGAGAELTRQRIETAPGAVIFRRSNDNAGMSAAGTPAPMPGRPKT